MTSYPADIEDSIKNHLAPDGVFAFTSSGGVYTENSGNVVDEKSAVVAAGRNKAILVSVIWLNYTTTFRQAVVVSTFTIKIRSM